MALSCILAANVGFMAEVGMETQVGMSPRARDHGRPSRDCVLMTGLICQSQPHVYRPDRGSVMAGASVDSRRCDYTG